ncbi:MAG: cupin domain-containing protein [Candidatus Brocadiia bacterium]
MKPTPMPYFIDPSTAPKFSQRAGLETVLLTGLSGEKMMMALNTTLPGHTVEIHSHPHEQVGIIYSGKALLRIGGKEQTVKKGDFYCIPANIPHGDTCLGDEPFIMLDVFYPIRQDIIDKYRKESK